MMVGMGMFVVVLRGRAHFAAKLSSFDVRRNWFSDDFRPVHGKFIPASEGTWLLQKDMGDCRQEWDRFADPSP